MTEPDVAPMNMWEAIEAMKIIVPHAATLAVPHGTGAALLRALVRAISTESPIQVLRLVALMHHKPVEAVAAELDGRPGTELVRLLAAGLAQNPLPDLVNGAFALGLTTVRWPDGRAN